MTLALAYSQPTREYVGPDNLKADLVCLPGRQSRNCNIYGKCIECLKWLLRNVSDEEITWGEWASGPKVKMDKGGRRCNVERGCVRQAVPCGKRSSLESNSTCAIQE